jgi:hypothetical protein
MPNQKVMRSTPSLDRGRFVLRRDVLAAAATGAMLVVAVLVLGWLTSGLVTGVWSPSQQAADAAGAAVKLAAPSDRAPRSKGASASSGRPLTAPEPPRADPAVGPRAHAVLEGRAPRRARGRRRADAQPSPSSTVPMPAAIPTATPAPVAAAVPAAATTEATNSATADTSEQETQRKAASEVSSERWSAAGRDDSRQWRPRGRGHRHDDGAGHQPTPVAVPSPPASGDHGESDQDGDWDQRGGRDERGDWDQRGDSESRGGWDDRGDDRHHGGDRRWDR